MFNQKQCPGMARGPLGTETELPGQLQWKLPSCFCQCCHWNLPASGPFLSNRHELGLPHGVNMPLNTTTPRRKEAKDSTPPALKQLGQESRLGQGDLVVHREPLCQPWLHPEGDSWTKGTEGALPGEQGSLCQYTDIQQHFPEGRNDGQQPWPWAPRIPGCWVTVSR